MPIYKLKLVAKETIANNTVLFRFEKPANFAFIPGQYGGFTLINPPKIDPTGLTRRFSLLSAPNDKYIEIAMRMQTSIFKQALDKLEIGQEVKFAGPTGNFILHDDRAIPAVLVAGGIGITPFYCMIKHIVRDQPDREIILFYGNRTTNDTAFFSELIEFAEQHPNFKLVYVMEESNGKWQGEVGYITDKILKKYVKDLSAPNYYVCGSPKMVTALQETLLEMGIASDKIKIEDFPGY